MTAARRLALGPALSLALAAAAAAGCGGTDREGGGESDLLDVEVASETDGLRATTEVDGQRIVIEARIVIDEAESDGGDPYRGEHMVASVTGADGTSYADWRLRVATDELDGTLAGAPFAEGLDQQARAGVDWAALASSPAGDVLTRVSERAAATIAAGGFPEMESQLEMVSQMGPALQLLPDIILAAEPICGDRQCTGDESDANCPEDCGCAAEAACGGVAPFGCYCSEDCAANGDCCVDSCVTCGAGCPPCGDRTPCDGSCTTIANVCDGQTQCPSGEDEAVCSAGACRAGQIACDDGTCREFFQFCDGTADCPGGEDELCECAYCEPG
ncbi:MAG TPA: low-density lipoprotein receptor class A repeat-containing protein [Kofleriaceae bacterium]|nr:low-density lipoprotein receptor class A repeat-containing protein [Kofleriaceae bacterium]